MPYRLTGTARFHVRFNNSGTRSLHN